MPEKKESLNFASQSKICHYDIPIQRNNNRRCTVGSDTEPDKSSSSGPCPPPTCRRDQDKRAAGHGQGQPYEGIRPAPFWSDTHRRQQHFCRLVQMEVSIGYLDEFKRGAKILRKRYPSFEKDFFAFQYIKSLINQIEAAR